MKKSILHITVFLAFAINSFSQEHGINFLQGTWNDALSQAKEQNKLIFLDAYTNWCMPCKKMEKEVFPQDKVAKFYNANFINLSMDMEKGEGPILVKMYDIRSYPTLLFISGDGMVIHRSSGYKDTKKFLELGAAAIDPDLQLSSLEKRFENGDRDSEFLKKLVQIKFLLFDGSHIPVAEEYIRTQKDLTTKENLEFIYRYVDNVGSEMFVFFVENKKLFEEKLGKRAVFSKITHILNNITGSKVDVENISLEKIDELFLKLDPEKAQQLSSKFRIAFYKQKGDKENFANAAINYYKNYKARSAEELNSIAWSFYRIVDDKKALKSGIKFAKKSIKLDNKYFNNDTLASLYFKIGKKKKALKLAKKAIEMAKKEGEDYTSTVELIEKINDID